MSDEVTNEPAGISEIVIDSDDKMFAYAMESLNKETTSTSEENPVENKPEDQPAEVEEKKDESAESAAAEPQAEEKVETPAPDTVKAEAKPLYTPEEIKAELRVHGDLARLDSSRLSEEGKLIQSSIMSGLTPKLQEAAELKKNYNALLQKERELAKKNAEAEAQRKFEEEKEQYGEEMAGLFKKVRDLETAREADNAERERERQAYLAAQQQVAAQQFHMTFVEKAKDYGIPNTPEMEEMVMAKVLAENQIRAVNQEQFMSVEDGMRFVSGIIAPSDTQRLESLLAANPKLMEALRSKFGGEVTKAKPAGATVIKSSGGGSGKSEVKPTAAPHDKLLDTDPKEWMVQQALSLAKSPNQ